MMFLKPVGKQSLSKETWWNVGKNPMESLEVKNIIGRNESWTRQSPGEGQVLVRELTDRCSLGITEPLPRSCPWPKRAKVTHDHAPGRAGDAGTKAQLRIALQRCPSSRCPQGLWTLGDKGTNSLLSQPHTSGLPCACPEHGSTLTTTQTPFPGGVHDLIHCNKQHLCTPGTFVGIQF